VSASCKHQDTYMYSHLGAALLLLVCGGTAAAAAAAGAYLAVPTPLAKVVGAAWWTKRCLIVCFGLFGCVWPPYTSAMRSDTSADELLHAPDGQVMPLHLRVIQAASPRSTGETLNCCPDRDNSQKA
jgi:hypothetical protein